MFFSRLGSPDVTRVAANWLSEPTGTIANMHRYYHGGVPGKRPGDQILSATALGYDHYVFAYGHTPGVEFSTAAYDPQTVYITTHLGSARGYAARFVHPWGRRQPGDVYEVQPTGDVADDPDFNAPGVYLSTTEPVVITRLVEHEPLP